jgi:hypothetical protein
VHWALSRTPARENEGNQKLSFLSGSLLQGKACTWIVCHKAHPWRLWQSEERTGCYENQRGLWPSHGGIFVTQNNSLELNFYVTNNVYL